MILNALRRLGQASKADLSRYVSLTNNTAGVIVKELEERKLIRSEGKRSGGRGQPATLLSLDPDGAHAIGVKFGRRSIDTLLVDFRGHVLDRRHHELDFPMPDEAIGLALHDIAALRNALPKSARTRMAGIGIATPYDMGSWRRELDIASEAYRVWNEVDLSSPSRGGDRTAGLPRERRHGRRRRRDVPGTGPRVGQLRPCLHRRRGRRRHRAERRILPGRRPATAAISA